MDFNLVKNTSEFYWVRSFIAAFKDDNSVVFYFFAPAVVHMSVECVGVKGLGVASTPSSSCYVGSNSVMYQFFAPAVGHLSVEYVLRFVELGLHLPLQVCVELGPITCGFVSMFFSVLSISGT